MSFSQSAGTTVVPTLSRIVLCAAFITAGYNKLRETEFSGSGAQRLIELEVVDAPGNVASASRSSRGIHFASLQDDASQDPENIDEKTQQALEDFERELAEIHARMLAESGVGQDGAGQDATGEQAGLARRGRATEPAQDEDAPPQAPDPAGEATIEPQPQQPQTTTEQPATTAVQDDLTVDAMGLHGITLMLDKQFNGERPDAAIYLAWAAALTEFIGGILLLIGLFSRIWALGLASVMGVAFYLTSLGPLMESSPLLIGLDQDHLTTLFLQLGLFVLALGVALTGPGPLSLDRLIFRRAPREDGADLE